MALDPVEFVACEECGCLNERATALLEQARQQIAELERDLRAKRSKITALERDQTAKLRQSPRYQEALEVLRHWRKVCMPTAREIDSDDRLAAVLARMNGGYTVEQLKACADGYSKRPYVTRDGRSVAGTPAERKVDASLIFGTPKHVDNGIAYAQSSISSSPFTGSIERLSWRQVKAANRRFIIRALQEANGTKGLELDGGYLELPCPRCAQREPDRDIWLTISPPESRTDIVYCWNCGLDETRLIAAMTEDNK